MKFTTAIGALLAGVAAQIAYAAPTKQAREVWTPPILYPHAGTVWYSGQRHNVTWGTDDIPVNITGGDNSGRISLRFDDVETPVLLAWDFNVRVGRTEVTVPNVFTGNFSLVFWGDSGDIGETFTIIGPLGDD